MTSGMFLSEEEVRELSKRIQHAAQASALRSMGIEHKIRPDGSIAVLRQYIEKEFGCSVSKKPKLVTTPNWSALDAKTA